MLSLQYLMKEIMTKKQFRYWEQEEARSDLYFGKIELEQNVHSINDYLKMATKYFLIDNKSNNIFNASKKLFRKEDHEALYIQAYVMLKSGFSIDYCTRHIKIAVRREISSYLNTPLEDEYIIYDKMSEYEFYDNLIFDGIHHSIVIYLLDGYSRSDIYELLNIKKHQYDKYIKEIRDKLIDEPEHGCLKNRMKKIQEALSLLLEPHS